MEAGTFCLAFLADASAFPSVYNFLFAKGLVMDLGAAELEGFSVRGLGASLGDFLEWGETFASEGLKDGLLRMAHWSYMGISSGTSSWMTHQMSEKQLSWQQFSFRVHEGKLISLPCFTFGWRHDPSSSGRLAESAQCFELQLCFSLLP